MVQVLVSEPSGPLAYTKKLSRSGEGEEATNHNVTSPPFVTLVGVAHRHFLVVHGYELFQRTSEAYAHGPSHQLDARSSTKRSKHPDTSTTGDFELPDTIHQPSASHRFVTGFGIS